MSGENRTRRRFASLPAITLWAAGLWDAWKPPEDVRLHSFTIMTTDPDTWPDPFTTGYPGFSAEGFDEWLNRKEVNRPTVHLFRPFSSNEMKTHSAHPKEAMSVIRDRRCSTACESISVQRERNFLKRSPKWDLAGVSSPSSTDYSGGAMPQREFDIILYGATGFTGRQAVYYLQQNAPPEIRWAVSGRNRQKLELLSAGVPIIVCDSTDQSQADSLVSQAHVLLSTAGPFALYSDQLVEACVKCRTHYVDITGEIAWVRSLIDRFHVQAERNGTRIIPFCGFDSVPADLGVYLLSKKLGPSFAVAKAYFQVRGGRPNGGTVASAHYTYSSSADKVGQDLFLLNPSFRRAPQPLELDPTRVSYDRDVKSWIAPFPMSIIDSRVVRRSCALRGTDITYQEFMIFQGALAPIWAALAAAGTGLFYALLRSKFTRNLLHTFLRAGSGPSERSMNNGTFRCRLWGRTKTGETAEVTLAGTGDPANRITVLCVCESALALAANSRELPDRAGVLTPSTGIGDALVRRLLDRGIRFSQTQDPPTRSSGPATDR